MEDHQPHCIEEAQQIVTTKNAKAHYCEALNTPMTGD
jgi:hypothetical protein